MPEVNTVTGVKQMKIRVVLPDVKDSIVVIKDNTTVMAGCVYEVGTPVYFKSDTREIDLNEFKDWCIKNYQLEVGCGEKFDALVRKLEQFIKYKLEILKR
jgi:hypothetical protein